MSKRAQVLVVLFLLVLVSFPASAQQSRPPDEITKLAEDVYLFRHQSHQAIFILTSKGVIVTDPISTEAATWLKAEDQETHRSACAICDLQPPP